MAETSYESPLPRRRVVAATLLWVLFGSLLLAAGWLFLRGCGLVLPGSSQPLFAYCSAETGKLSELAALRAEEEALRTQLHSLNRQTSAIPECGEDCILSKADVRVDLYFLQDLSSSFRDDLPNFQRMIKDLVRRHESGALGRDVSIGFGSFIDKPLSLRAQVRGDYTFRPMASMQASSSEIVAAAESLQAGYGGVSDAEAQYEAIIELLGNTAAVGFREGAKKIIIIVTDAEALSAGGWPDAPAPEDGFADGDPMNEDYPSFDQVSQALRAHDATPIFLVTDGVTGFYNDFVRQHGDGIVGRITSDSENLTNAIFSSLATRCGA